MQQSPNKTPDPAAPKEYKVTLEPFEATQKTEVLEGFNHFVIDNGLLIFMFGPDRDILEIRHAKLYRFASIERTDQSPKLVTVS